jgi:hypothetical protein
MHAHGAAERPTACPSSPAAAPMVPGDAGCECLARADCTLDRRIGRVTRHRGWNLRAPARRDLVAPAAAAAAAHHEPCIMIATRRFSDAKW